MPQACHRFVVVRGIEAIYTRHQGKNVSNTYHFSMQRMLDAGDLRPVPPPQWLTDELISLFVEAEANTDAAGSCPAVALHLPLGLARASISVPYMPAHCCVQREDFACSRLGSTHPRKLSHYAGHLPSPPSPPSPPPWPPGTMSASTVGEFTAAIADSSIDKIWLAAGTYELTTDMCTGSAICIDRALTIEAEVPGAAVLNAMYGRRVFEIQSGGTVELIGLNITGGSASASVQSVCLSNPL
jgi:hypothetical protein